MSFVGLLLAAAAYLIGSLSSALIVSKKFAMPDPRSYGSGNPGASNMLRSGRQDAAALTLAGDLLKGMAAVLLARAVQSWLDMGFGVVALSAVAVVVGHMWPVFFGFKGGKGVATALGVLLVLSFPAALWSMAAWAAVFWKFRKSSLASLAACATALIFGFVYSHTPAQGWSVFVIAVLVACRHRENISRLLNGSELSVAPLAQPETGTAAAGTAEAADRTPETAESVDVAEVSEKVSKSVQSVEAETAAEAAAQSEQAASDAAGSAAKPS